MLRLYADEALTEPLQQVEVSGKKVHNIEMPSNKPGETVHGKFYILNDSPNTVENIQVLHNNGQVDFYYKDWVAPDGKVEVTVEWRAPIDLQDALALTFEIKADEVVKPRF